MSYLICLCMISYIMCLIDSDIIYNAGRLASSQACPSTSRTTDAVLCTDDDVHQQAWLEYLFSRVHPILSWLPGLNWQRGWVKTLGRSCVLPPSKALNGLWGGWNGILESNLVPNHNGKGQLRTFCCIQREFELYSGRPKARRCPFNLSGHRFRGKNRQVFHIV
jgi:hypothetical protein